MMTKREYGTGGVTWVTNTKVRLSTRVTGERRTRVVKVAHKDHGGRGQAAEALAEFEKELTEAKDTPKGTGVTVKKHLADYVAHCRRIGRAESTAESYEMVFRRVPPELGALALMDLSVEDLDDLYTGLKERGLAVNTIRTTHASLSAALEQGVRWKRIASNPAENATPPSRDATEAEPLTPAEVARMAIAAAALDDLVLTMAIILAALTGARRGELCGFRWDDLDEQGCSITIQRQWVPGKGGQRLEHPKSKKGTRRVYLGAEGMGVLEQYRGAIRDLLREEPDGWLLSHDGGATPLRAKALGEAITVIGKSVGLGVTTHRFRKVQATQLVAAGVDVDTAARRMGHTKGVMFDHYMLGAEDKSVAAAELVEARLIEQGLRIGEIFKAP